MVSKPALEKSFIDVSSFRKSVTNVDNLYDQLVYPHSSHFDSLARKATAVESPQNTPPSQLKRARSLVDKPLVEESFPRKMSFLAVLDVFQSGNSDSVTVNLNIKLTTPKKDLHSLTKTGLVVLDRKEYTSSSAT